MLHVPTSLDVQPASPKQPGLRIFMNWALSALCLSFLTLVLTFSASGQILYGLSNGSGFDPTTNQIYRIDPATGATSNHHVVTLGGVPVDRSNALAIRPSDGAFFAVVQVGTGAGARRLVTIDPNTGIATQIGVLTQSIAGLAFSPDGTLWAVSGDGSTVAETLWTVNTSTAALTQQWTLGNGDDGEAIAFNPTNGILYHSSGFDPAVFESVNVATGVVTPIGAPDPASEAFGMSYSRVLSQMFLSDIDGNLYTVDIATGARTLVAPIDSPIDPDSLLKVANRGLAFFEFTTAAPADISGRLVTRSGDPVHKGTVTAVGQNGDVYTAKSDNKGRFRLNGLPTGETYVISAEAKRYRFTSTVINLSEDLTGLTLTATR